MNLNRSLNSSVRISSYRKLHGKLFPLSDAEYNWIWSMSSADDVSQCTVDYVIDDVEVKATTENDYVVTMIGCGACACLVNVVLMMTPLSPISLAMCL